MKISRKTRRKYRLKAKRLVYQFKKIVRGKKTLPIRSEREFANLVGADSLRLARKVAMGMSLKLSHLPEDLGEDEWCTDCGNSIGHWRGDCGQAAALAASIKRFQSKSR